MRGFQRSFASSVSLADENNACLYAQTLSISYSFLAKRVYFLFAMSKDSAGVSFGCPASKSHQLLSVVLCYVCTLQVHERSECCRSSHALEADNLASSFMLLFFEKCSRASASAKDACNAFPRFELAPVAQSYGKTDGCHISPLLLQHARRLKRASERRQASAVTW